MPAVAAVDLARLRFTKHATLLRLAVYTPAAIWTAQVDGAQATGYTSITVKNVVPTARTPAQHYQVLIGSTAGGREYGETRYEDYAALVLTVGAHNCELPDNAYITVLEEIKPQGISATIDSSDVVTEDGGLRPYTDQNLNFEPLARCGPPAVAYRDPTTGIATVKFYGNPVPALGTGAGITITDHAWDFVDGNPAASAIQGTSAVPISVEYNSAGERYISYWVQDSNGKTHATRRPVFIFDRYSGTLPYTQIEISSMEGDVESGGWRSNLTVYTDAGVDAFPPQALCVVFAEDWFGSEEVSIGGHYTYRENIVMVGYIRRGTTRKDWARGVVEFELEGIGCVMDNIPGIALSLEASAAPTGWHELDNLCAAMATFHLITEHSTIDNICDIHLTPVLYEQDFIDTTEISLLQQISQEIGGRVRARCGSNAQGMFYLETNPQLLPLASRTNPVVLSTNFVDFRGELAFDAEDMEKQVSQVDFCSETTDGDPIFSLAPPYPWPMGRLERIDGIRADTQAESNILSGLYEGYLNNQYANVNVTWRGNYRVFDVFPAEAVNVNITAAQNKRGIVWTEQRCWTKRVSYEYRGGILLASTVLEKDAYGAPGMTGEYPVTPPEPDPRPPEPEPKPPDPKPPEPIITPGDGSRVYLATELGVLISDDFLGVPTWTAVNNGLAGDALDVYRFLFDPWSSDGTKLTTAFIVTKDGVYKGTGLPAPVWTRVLSLATIKTRLLAYGLDPTIVANATMTREMILPINVEDYISVAVQAPYSDYGPKFALYTFYSLDNGATWSNAVGVIDANVHALINGPLGITDGCYAFCAFPSNTTAALQWISTNSCLDHRGPPFVLWTTNSTVWHSDTTAQFWEFSATWLPFYNGYVILPFANNAGVPYTNDTRAYRTHAFDEFTTGAAALGLLTLFPAGGQINKGDAAMQLLWQFDLCTWNEDYIYALEAVDDTTGTQSVWSTNDGCATWQEVDVGWVPMALTALPNNEEFCAIAGSDAGQGVVKLTLDGGATWADKTGDLQVVKPNITKVRSIVPDWIKVT